MGLASPAQAAPDVTGTYSKVPTNNPSDNPPTTWTVTSCGADCVHVVSSLPAEYDLHLVNGHWTVRCTRNTRPSAPTVAGLREH